MKKSRSRFSKGKALSVAALGLLLLAVSARGEDWVRYRAKPIGSKVRIDGSANVHEWGMDGNIIGGYFEVPKTVVIDSSQAELTGLADGKLPARGEASIPVTSVKSGVTGMDEVMLQAMKAADYERIVFHLTDLTLKQPHAAGSPFEFDAKGELAIAGVTNKISLPIKIETLDAAKLKISSSGVLLKMTDFKVPPPVKLGVFRTKDEVKISFEWVVGKPVVK